jgi:hypothetical protein
MKPSELEVPRNRCIYNIKSAQWAAANFVKTDNFKTGNGSVPKELRPIVDSQSSDEDFVAPQTRRPFSVELKAQPGDKVSCDTCSLQNKCKHYREGAVCTLPDAEPRELATMFGSRDSDVILDGLATLMSTQANRLKRGLRDEQMDGEIDPRVTSLANTLFQQGVTLAKLVDPELRGGAKVQVNVNGAGSQTTVLSASPQQMMAGIISQLEAKGIARSEITPEMIKGLLQAQANGGVPRPQTPMVPQAIVGEVIKHE